MSQFTVSLSPGEAAGIIHKYVLGEGMSTECVGEHRSSSPEGHDMIAFVFEKYYMRNSSRASLSVVVDNLTGRTRVFSVGSGGGQSVLFKFDWGASDSFSSLPERALREYII